MHSSIAKALVKGKVRSAATSLCEQSRFLDELAPTSGKKSTLSFFDDYINTFSELALYKFEKKKISSWHKKVGLVSVMPTPKEFEGIGKIHPINIQFLCTRRYVKANSKTFAEYYFPGFCVHEHFMQRVLQRTDIEGLQTVKDLVSRALIGCSLLNVSLSDEVNQDKRVFHTLSDKYIVITTYHPNRDIFVFNTVLETAQMNAEQNNFYRPLMVSLTDDGKETGVYCIDSCELLDLGFDMNYDSFERICKKLFALID
jgi:hypothetical protein